jgi:membrane protease YdiL (CAAX protease family)
MNNLGKFLLVAFLCWLAPFVVSLPFFSPEGTLLINFWLFKALMVTVLFITAFIALRWFYRRAELPATRPLPYALIGVGILLINVVMDMLTILQFYPMTVSEYDNKIAAVYLLFIPLSLWVGRTSKGGVQYGS